LAQIERQPLGDIFIWPGCADDTPLPDLSRRAGAGRPAREAWRL